MDWEATQRFNVQHDRPQYAVGLNSLLALPFFDWSLRTALARYPELAGQHANWSDSVEVSRITHHVACRNLTTYLGGQSAIVLTQWAWLPGLLRTEYTKFQEWFGSDTYGAPQVHAGVAPVLLSPSRTLVSVVDELGAVLAHTMDFTIALQVRAGGTPFDQKNGHLPMLHQDKLGSVVRCAYAAMPATARETRVRIGWLLVTDSSSARSAITELIATSEGAVESIRPIGGAVAAFNGTKVVFVSGSHLIFLASEVVASTKLGAEMAIVEMWALAKADLLVVTEGSSFADIGRVINSQSSFVATLNGRCYPEATHSALGPGMMYFGGAPCFSMREVQHDWFWKVQTESVPAGS